MGLLNYAFEPTKVKPKTAVVLAQQDEELKCPLVSTFQYSFAGLSILVQKRFGLGKRK